MVVSTPAAKQQYSLGRVLVTMALGLSRLSCIANGASESHVNSFVPCTEYVRSKSEKIDINTFKIDHQGSMPPVSLPINHYRVRVCVARLCVLFVCMYIYAYFFEYMYIFYMYVKQKQAVYCLTARKSPAKCILLLSP